MRLENRVGKLEAASGAGNVTVILWHTLTETDDQAVERWKTEHPGQETEHATCRETINGVQGQSDFNGRTPFGAIGESS